MHRVHPITQQCVAAWQWGCPAVYLLDFKCIYKLREGQYSLSVVRAHWAWHGEDCSSQGDSTLITKLTRAKEKLGTHKRALKKNEPTDYLANSHAEKEQEKQKGVTGAKGTSWSIPRRQMMPLWNHSLKLKHRMTKVLS